MLEVLTRQQYHHASARKEIFVHAGTLLRRPLISTTCLLVLIVIAYISNDFNQNKYFNHHVGYLKGSMLGYATISSSPFNPTHNSQLMRDWRIQTETACRNLMTESNNEDTPIARQLKEQIERDAISKFEFPSALSGSLSTDQNPYQFCRNVFIDLGTNIGDSIGYFIDNSLDVCSPIWMETHSRTHLNADFPRPHLDVTTLEVTHKGSKNNPLYGMLQQQLKKTIPVVSPDTFCVYGMEGNPEFTERLQKLENHVMQTHPRPVRHLHIHTESVVTAVDGPTKLFLDKISVEQNVSFFIVCTSVFVVER